MSRRLAGHTRVTIRVGSPATQAVLNSLESADGSPAHFNWSEFYSHDGSGFSGGKVSEAVVRENVRRLMYKLEALRGKTGNNSITVNSGFRSIAHNRAVGGASNSQYLYGVAADIVASNRSVLPGYRAGQNLRLQRHHPLQHLHPRGQPD